MVNYSAYNVDPLQYRQAGMGNLTNAYSLRDKRNQYAAQNALEQQRLNEMQKRTGLESRRIDEMARRTDIDKEWYDTRGKAFQADLLFNAANLVSAAPDKETAGLISERLGEKFDFDPALMPYKPKPGVITMPKKYEDGSWGGITIKGSPEKRKDFIDKLTQNPSLMKDDVSMARLAGDLDLELDISKTSTVKKAEPKDDTKEYNNFIKSNIEEMLMKEGVFEKDGQYYVNTPDGLEEPATKYVPEIRRRARAKAARVRAHKKREGFDTFWEAALDYEMKLAKEAQVQQRRDEATRQRDEKRLRQVAPQNTPNMPPSNESQSPLMREGVDNPITQKLMGISKWWESNPFKFGMNAKDAYSARQQK